jgi:hypothetical protein
MRFRTNRISVLLGQPFVRILLVLSALVAPSYSGSAAETYEEQLRNLERLAAEVQACGGNEACLRERSERLQAAGEKLRFDSGLARSGEAMTGAQQALADQQDDPCYPVLLEKEYARRFGGSDLPWVSCVPVQLTLTWRLTDRTSQTGWPDVYAQFVLTEQYPAYLQIVRDPDDRRVIHYLELFGPSPEGSGQVSLQSINAGMRAEFPSVRGPPQTRMVSSTNPSAFQAGPHPGRLRFQHNTAYRTPPVLMPENGRISLAQVIPVPQRILGVQGRLLDVMPYSAHPFEVVLQPAEIPSAESLMSALESGRWEGRFPVDHVLQIPPSWAKRRHGELTVQAIFAPVRPVLTVEPATGFDSTGPDRAGRFTPADTAYTLENTGNRPIEFSVSADKPWVSISRTSGALRPGEKMKITVAVVSDKAKALDSGTHHALLDFTNRTNNQRKTTRPVNLTIDEETQRWRVFLAGYEIDEMDPYWKQTTRIRGAIRFDYTLHGEFTLRKKEDQWVYAGGTISLARVGLSSLYEPLGAWVLKPLSCNKCDDVTALKGRPLSGSVGGSTVGLYWGKVVPETNVWAQIVVSCIPMPRCAEGNYRLYKSERFFDDVNRVPLPLRQGLAASRSVVNSEGSRWIHFEYSLERLDK